MKKTLFTALRAMCVGAMTLFAVSCYDDSALWGEVDRLDGRIDSLATALNSQIATINEKVGALDAAYKAADEALLAQLQAKDTELAASITALTTKLDALDGTLDGYITSNDAALKAAIEAYKKEVEALKGVDTEILAALAGVGVVNVAKNDAGNVVLTFTDKTQIEVPANANVNNAGLVTVVDGKWAIVGADGKTTVLDADLHPDTALAFKVQDDVLYVSYDGGKTWEKTDVVVNDETTINVVEGFEYNEGDPFLTLTVGGVDYILPVYQADNSSLVLGRAEAFFMYGATKNVELTKEDITEYYIMSKPDGWKASVDGTTLTVTAPAKALVELGAAELEGQVLIHATTATGTCKVVAFDVETGEALTISYKDGNITFFNALTTSEKDYWTEEILYSFAPAWFGLIPVEEYLTYNSFEEFMASKPEPLSNLTGIIQNSLDLYYEAGKCEEIQATMSLKDIIDNSWSDFELDENETYVFWCVPAGTSSYLYDQGVYTVTGAYIALEKSNSVYNNVDLKISTLGVEGTYIGATSKTDIEKWIEEELSEEEALQLLYNHLQYGPYGMGGPWKYFTDGDATAMGDLYHAGVRNIQLNQVVLPDYMGNRTVASDNEYYVWILPYEEGKAASDYNIEDLVIYTCVTEPMIKDNTYKATVEYTPGYKSVKYTITPPQGGATKFTLYSEEEYNNYFVVDSVFNESLVVAEFSNNSWAIEEAYTENQTYMIEPGEKYVIMTYSTKDGYYALTYDWFTSPEFDSPNGKQWMFTSEYFDALVEGENSSYCFDFGVAWADLEIESLKGATVIGVDYGTVPAMAESGAPVGSWYPAFPSYAVSEVTPTDATSGTISYLGATLTYSDLTETSCTFDLSELLGEDEGTVVINCTLAEELVPILAQ